MSPPSSVMYRANESAPRIGRARSAVRASGSAWVLSLVRARERERAQAHDRLDAGDPYLRQTRNAPRRLSPAHAYSAIHIPPGKSPVKPHNIVAGRSSPESDTIAAHIGYSECSTTDRSS